MENNLGLLLAKRAFLNPRTEAFVNGNTGERLTFEALNNRCNQLANALVADGIQKGDRLAILLMNGSEFIETYFACAKIGAVAVPLNWRLVPDELEFILKDSGAKRLIFGEEFYDNVVDLESRGDKTDVTQWLQLSTGTEIAQFAVSYQQFRDAGNADEPPIRASDDDMMYIMYTSGTTGLPKGVVHTHKSSIWGVLTIAATMYAHEGDRYLNPLPMFHVGSLTPLTIGIYQGITNVVMRSFDPKLAWEIIEKERVTTGLMVPAMLNFMLQIPDHEKYDSTSVRWFMSGAAPVPVSLIEAYAALDIEIQQVYGLTETCGPACLTDSEAARTKAGSTGKAFFHTEVKIVDGDGNECAPNVPGEVLVRGPHIMREYWNRPDATAESIIDGWLHTGDSATMDDEGFVYIQDRIKDMVISGGENVYPAEIEAVLMQHPNIVEAGVIGKESAKWGESPFAVVVKNDNALSENDVLQFCSDKLARFKQPKGVAFAEQIPRNPSGKILKRLLREQFPDPAPE
ncbi:MAG: long-chain-fatty-acid--CoA ligase [Pseudomonadota bacterium]